MNQRLSGLFLLMMLSAIGNAAEPEDAYLWLEEVLGKKALEYVETQNAIAVKELTGRPEYAGIYAEAMTILNAKDRIPFPAVRNGLVYNFWRDAANPRGLWRRTPMAEYQKAEPQWEIVLDIDALAKAEKENWVWQGTESLPPKHERALLSFSRGGGDAKVVREFDLVKKEFLKDGFTLPEAKSRALYRDENTLYVGTDFGPGSMTDSGYPRVIKRWKRGTPLAQAETVFEGQKTDVAVEAYVDHAAGFFREGFDRSITFYTSEAMLVVDGKPVKLEIPEDAKPNFFREWLLVNLRSDWNIGGKKFDSGALLAVKLDAFLKGGREFELLFQPTARVSLGGFATTQNSIVLNVNDNVRGRVMEVTTDGAAWQMRDIKLPGKGAANAWPMDDSQSSDLWVQYEDFLTPTSLYAVKSGANPGDAVKTLPAYFNGGGMEVRQLEATSKDGTKVPYSVMGKSDALKSKSAPTLLYGYGGFEISLMPQYAGVRGKAWLERGGVFVLANIRGGGEFGPAWHRGALKEKRQNGFDDFAAVAQDLVQRGVTQTKNLGIMGGSNGGLLVSTVGIQRPELFGAVVCQVPLTDMRRFNKMLAGASWMAEYGDPDKAEEWAFLSKYSPYQNVKKEGKYPRILFTTSTRDDRVHPAHARKLYAKMLEMGHSVLYFENTEGGHAGAANNEQRARMVALEYTFLWNALK